MVFKFLGVLIMLAVSVTLIKAKKFSCAELYVEGSCTITRVGPQDDRIDIAYSELYGSIRNLTITNSAIDDIPSLPSIFSNMTYLSCVGCGLTDITKHSFIPLKSLEELNICFGSYSKLQKDLFSQLSSLKHLNASHGNITEIHDTAFSNLIKLKKLDLAYNNITRINRMIFSQLPSLQFLNLSNNRIEILDNGPFVNNHQLKYLYLEHNKINRIDGQLCSYYSVMSEIHLTDNELTKLDTTHCNFAMFWADNNRITEVHIRNTIIYLNADHNKIKTVICDEIDSPLPLSGLSLNNNSLTDLGCIGSLTQLNRLHLDYNNLGKLNHSSFARLTELKVLTLTSANTGRLEYGVFSHQNKLETLDISYNQMGNIALEMLLAARGLQLLYIDGNNMTEFSFAELKTEFTDLRTIGIGDNDFNCTFLGQAMKQLNKDNIAVTVSSGKKVTDTHNINGIRCREVQETVASLPPLITSVSNGNATSEEVNGKLNAVIQQVDEMSNKLNNSNSTNDVIKSLSVFLIILIVAFFIYKGYKCVKNNLPRISRSSTAVTLNTNIEMDSSNGK